MWDERYARDEYVYGTEPNDFVVEVASRIPGPRILSLGEGEGRNAVYLAKRGFDVVGVDGSSVGLSKARRLAREHGVSIETVVADLAAFEIQPGRWDAVISIFCHLPPELRRLVHGRVVAGLRPGGLAAVECYTPRQLEYGTGGPPTPELLYGIDVLRDDFTGLEIELAEEVEREVDEGEFHKGLSHVARFVARKPGPAAPPRA
jgi:SAM-dependent methyltransferase